MNFYDKSIECLDDNREQRIMQGKKKETSVRMLKDMQEKCNCRKRCMLFVVPISSDKGKEDNDVEVLNKYLILKKFQDVFPAKVLEFPLHNKVDFSI